MDKEKINSVGNQMAVAMFRCLEKNAPLSLQEAMAILTGAFCCSLSDICDKNELSYNDVMAEAKKIIDAVVKGIGDE